MDTEDLETMPPPGTHVDVQDGRNLARKTAVVLPVREEEARDSSPDVEGRQDFWSIMCDSKNRNHDATRTTLYLIVRTSSARWRDRATSHASSSRRLRWSGLYVRCAQSPR